MKQYPIHFTAILMIGLIELVAIEHGIDGTFMKITCGSITGIASSIPITAIYNNIKNRRAKKALQKKES
jgi:hypothetical protein